MPQDRKSPDIKQSINIIHLLRILEASDAPPVNSLTLASKKGVSTFPCYVIFPEDKEYGHKTRNYKGS